METSDPIQLEDSRLIQNGDQIRAMVHSAGWKLIEGAILKTIDVFKESLVDEHDPRKQIAKQETIKAYRSLLNEIDFQISQADSLREQRTLTEEDNPDDR